MTTYIKHPLIKKDSIESRLYQQILAGDVLKKGNTMVVAPTALGKTIVAILVAADRLQKVKNSKVLILSPSKPIFGLSPFSISSMDADSMFTPTLYPLSSLITI